MASVHHAVLLAVLATISGCGGVKPEAAGASTRQQASPEEAVVAAPLVTYEVHAPEARAGLLRRYAQETRLESRSEAGVLKAGPFLSYFEASWLAGLVPGGSAVRRETYDEPASPAPFAGLREAAGRTAAYVGTRRVAGERFALVTWEGDQEQKDLELYQTHASGPRFLAKLPSKPGLEVSSGMLFTKVGEEGTLLQVMNERREGAVKAERLIAWRFALGSRQVLFDLPFFSLELPSPSKPPSKPEDAKKGQPAKAPEVQAIVTRLVPEGVGVRITSYRVTLKALDAAKDVSLALNDWNAEIWKDKEKPDLVELVKVERSGERTSSLE
jgi:hypothetical protein